MNNYVINCYTCQHNGQETCKGCNVLLNGEDEPFENWKLREDLEEKDKRIKVLERALELACDNSDYEDTCDYCAYKGELDITKDCPCFCETQENFHREQAMGYFISQAEKEIEDEVK